jgi:hypothetical protein
MARFAANDPHGCRPDARPDRRRLRQRDAVAPRSKTHRVPSAGTGAHPGDDATVVREDNDRADGRGLARRARPADRLRRPPHDHAVQPGGEEDDDRGERAHSLCIPGDAPELSRRDRSPGRLAADVIARVTILVGVCCATLASAAAAANPPGPTEPIDSTTPSAPAPPPASATLSSTKAGAKPVELTLKVRYDMICGQPGPGTAIVTLPPSVSLPGTIASAALLVNGKPAPKVDVSGHEISVTLPRRHGITCLVIAPGTLTLTFTKSAGLGNPARGGRYTIRVRHATRSFTAHVDISA